MSNVLELPDVEALMVEHLTGHPLLAEFAGLRVSTDLHEDRPALTLSHLGGAPANRIRLDRPLVDFYSWDPDRATAKAVIRRARVAVFEAEGKRFSNGAVTAVRDEDGPRWIPDPETAEPRWVCSLAVYTSPLI